MFVYINSFVVGLIFAIGLGVSGMTQPQKVVGFLDIFGTWDPALMMVMVGAILLHSISYFLVTKRESPILVDQFQLPTSKDLTPRLILGGVLFGAGWGLGGYCPGPGIVSVASGDSSAFTFVIAMLVGMGLFKLANPFVNKIFK